MFTISPTRTAGFPVVGPQPSFTDDPVSDAAPSPLTSTAALALRLRFDPALMSMLVPDSNRTVWSLRTSMLLLLMETRVVVGPPISIPVAVIFTAPAGPNSSMPVSVMLSL